VLCLDLLMPVLNGNILSLGKGLLDLLGEMIEIHQSFALLLPFASPFLRRGNQEYVVIWQKVVFRKGKHGKAFVKARARGAEGLKTLQWRG
jgi:hypothetical protein